MIFARSSSVASIALLFATVWLNCAVRLFAQSADDSEINFNRDIRPILAENCFYCHGQDAAKRQADLRLDDRDAAITHGAIVPGELATSSMIARIRSTNPDELMPPAKSNRRLTEEQKALMERWISSGANYSKHWAFEAPVRPEPPNVTRPDWVRNPIDAFVLAELDERGMQPTVEAERVTLIRRLHIDLTGLPPRPEEVDAFVNDADPQAYEKLVDRLLASPHYGERMSLSWLDAARYADSNGFQQDGDTWQWIWRDWVVQALNEDLPFDQFTVWQLAGDLLPNATTEQKIASGFNRNHLLNGEGGAIPEEQRWVILFDRMETTSTTWLGLTMNCAQCHDHKYDPMTQKDYYSLLDAFNRVPETGTPQYFSSRIRVAPPLIELPTDEDKAKIAEMENKIAALAPEAQKLVTAAYDGWKVGLFVDGKPADGKGLPDSAAVILGKLEADRSAEEKAELEKQLRKHFDEKVLPQLQDKLPEYKEREGLTQQLANYRADRVPRVMVMSDDKPRETFILSRGEYLNPTEKVSFATPAFLPAMPADAPKNRLGFAQWLMAPEHPLTARVQVNRMWQHFFGAGIIKTAEDFGVQSEYPVHGPLLDWLAVQFREGGWSMKAIHRFIVTSATYRQSSRVTEQHRSEDPENRLYTRASRFRMPSLVLRDWALASSGILNNKIGGVPVYPYQPDDIWESLAITKERDFTYPASHGSDLYRRSLYTFWRRTVAPANMFDASNRQACRVRQSPTSTPLHALTTLNDPTWIEAARKLAEQSLTSASGLDQQLSIAFRSVMGRAPSASDLTILHRAFQKQQVRYAADPESARQLLAVGESPGNDSLPLDQHAAMSAVCLAILNLDEAVSRE